MIDPDDAQDTAPRQLEEQLSEELKAFGFDPGIPVHEVDKLDFDLDQIKEALFGSTYRQPITLPFFIGSRNPMDFSGPDLDLEMVVELVQAFYPPQEVRIGETPIGCFDMPEWYLRGFVYKSGFDPQPEVVRMHVYIQTTGTAGEFNGSILQIVSQPSGAPPATRLVFA